MRPARPVRPRLPSRQSRGAALSGALLGLFTAAAAVFPAWYALVPRSYTGLDGAVLASVSGGLLVLAWAAAVVVLRMHGVRRAVAVASCAFGCTVLIAAVLGLLFAALAYVAVLLSIAVLWSGSSFVPVIAICTALLLACTSLLSIAVTVAFARVFQSRVSAVLI